MQLAALHLATSSVLPDKLLGMTGEERAVTLIRQCWVNRPLGEEECLALDNVKQLAKGLSATISLLCQDIELSSKQFNFLHSNIIDHSHIKTECYEGAAYLNNVKNKQLSSRCYLTAQEESQMIGVQARRFTLPSRFVPNQILSPSPVTEVEVDSIQKRLDEIQSKSARKNKKAKLHDDSFPLKDVKSSSKLELDMMNELNESWVAHISNSMRHATSSVERPDAGTLQAIQKLQNDVVASRKKAESFALNALNQVPETSSHWHDNAHDLLRTVGLIPTASATDLAKCAIDASVITTFNPMLTLESCAKLVESILIWLRLCVYEDKLGRLVSFFRSGSLDEMTREIDTVTIWDTAKHPYWLIFEVENGIQIRQEQYKVAQHLIDNPGDVIQLNMGLGKVSNCINRFLSYLYVLTHLLMFLSDKGDSANVDLTCLFEET